MIILSLCILLFVCCCLVFLWKKQTECYSRGSTPSCIITMTTFMGFEDRFKNIDEILKPLVATGQEVVVINEWDNNYHVYVAFMSANYPCVHFIQKTKEDYGQVRSLNILIRDHLLGSRKKYWIHWEDTWVCTRPLLPGLVDLMEKNPNVAQLQATDDWKDVPPDHTIDLNDIKILKPQHIHNKDIYEMMEKITLETWPLFSLRPSINRLSFFQRHSNDFYFLENPHLWPLRFEWEFGRIFLRNKGVKAITKKPYARRVKDHKSTYYKLLTGDHHSSG